MTNHTSMRYLIILLLGLSFSQFAVAQEQASADDLFRQARQEAFDHKDYNEAKLLAQKALQQVPDYYDIRIFLGRLYAWTNKPDSAAQAFEQVLQKQPDNEDALAAYTDLEFWNHHDEKALELCNRGLSAHPASTALLLKKAKVLRSMHRYPEAAAAADSVLQQDAKNAAALALVSSLKNQDSHNKIGLAYDYIYFDKQFDKPWQIASIDYTRQTKLGALTGRVNYASRYGQSGWQGEIDAYPHISNTFYAYMNFGYSGDYPVFPQYRGGFSLYANLPSSFEAEAGFRYLYFTSATWIYTASVGKYYKNWWFNFRTYLTPSNQQISQSYAFTARYYLGGADDYLSASLGTGISPDDRSKDVQLNNNYKLKAQKAALAYHKTLGHHNIIGISLAYTYEEYRPVTYGNQVDAGLIYQRKF